MKQTLYILTISSLALATTAWAADLNQVQRGRAARKSAVVQPAATSARASRATQFNAQRNYSTNRIRQRTYNAMPQTRSAAVVRQNTLRNQNQVVRERN